MPFGVVVVVVVFLEGLTARGTFAAAARCAKKVSTRSGNMLETALSKQCGNRKRGEGGMKFGQQGE